MDDGTPMDQRETKHRRWPPPEGGADGLVHGRPHAADPGPTPGSIDDHWPEPGQGPPATPPTIPGPNDPRWRPGLVPWGWRETGTSRR